eukprot:TRINITY_DN1811_c0_g1_i3.p2 TRINITY_DN1811_c0_g1~~TRINITY_DN1811_c0_g1_i3.p2  ORF type:complete len:250 (-),score=54.33 TRINITY_DN1811_c0_g1_i3:573-1322(-)
MAWPLLAAVVWVHRLPAGRRAPPFWTPVERSSDDGVAPAVARGPPTPLNGRRFVSGTRRLRRAPGAMQESDDSSSDSSGGAAAKALAVGAGGGHGGGARQATGLAASASAATAALPSIPAITVAARLGGPMGSAVAPVGSSLGGPVDSGGVAGGGVVAPPPPRGSVWMAVPKRLRKAVSAASASGERLYTTADVASAVSQAVASAEADARASMEAVVAERLAEQWQSFSRFNQDAVTRQYAGRELSYLS